MDTRGVCAAPAAEARRMDLCGDCNKEEKDHLLIQLQVLGKCFTCTVSSFPELQHIKYKFFEDEDDSVYDGFVQANNAASLKLGYVLRLCKGYTNAFVIEPLEYSKNVDVSGLNLLEEKVFVVWKRKLLSGEDEHEASETEMEEICNSNELSGEEENDGPEAAAPDTLLHSVVFKCIGTMKEERYQHILAEAALARRNKEEVKVRIAPESSNPVDSKAIAFQIFSKNQLWERVGYVVSEVLDSLHREIISNNIVAVEVEWIKFITHWQHSSPGWYCGIKITKKGSWDITTLRCRSTIS